MKLFKSLRDFGARWVPSLEHSDHSQALKRSDLEHYMGERGRRGNKLPRGYQRVDEAVVVINE